MNSTEQPKTLIEELGFTPWTPDYILVYNDEVLAFYPDLFKDRNFTRIESFTYDEETRKSDHHGYKLRYVDCMVVVMLSVSYRKKKEDYERDLASLPTDMIQAANLLIGLRGNEVKYFKDRSGMTAHYPSNEEAIQFFNTDLNKWMVKCGINSRPK